MDKQLQILHLSDLHIDTDNNFDRSLVLDPLIERVNEGVDFLGYRISPDYLKVRKSSVKRYRRRLGRMCKDYYERKINLEDINCSIQSWIGHVKHAASYRLREEMFAGTVFTRQVREV